MNMGEGGETVKPPYRELDLESPGQSASRAISDRPGLLWSDFCQVGLL